MLFGFEIKFMYVLVLLDNPELAILGVDLERCINKVLNPSETTTISWLFWELNNAEFHCLAFILSTVLIPWWFELNAIQ